MEIENPLTNTKLKKNGIQFLAYQLRKRTKICAVKKQTGFY